MTIDRPTAQAPGEYIDSVVDSRAGLGRSSTTSALRWQGVEELIHLVGRGEPAAYASLFTQLWPTIFGFVHRLVLDHHQAEEVAQDIFLQIWRHGARFDAAKGSARSWVLTISHARAVDRIRSAQAERLRDGAFVAGNHVVSSDVAEEALRWVDDAAVKDALTCLTGVQRESLQLFYVTGLSHQQIAAALKIPVPTVKTRIRNALLRLQRRLQATAGPVLPASPPPSRDHRSRR